MSPNACFSIPFLREELMEGAPPCAATDFKTPRLRRSLFSEDDIDWDATELLGTGLDGCAWKVFFKGKGPFVLKMFWDPEPPQCCNLCYAVQRECHNAALLQMIQESIDKAAKVSIPILIDPNPTTKEDAMDNLWTFCDEAREEARELQSTPQPEDCEMMPVSSTPRLAKCYGWLKFQDRNWDKLPRQARPAPFRIAKYRRGMGLCTEYYAIVYEYIPDGENDAATVENVARFLWRVGFSHTLSSLRQNWKAGVLVDHSDIVYFRDYGWHVVCYGPRNAGMILQD